MYLKNKTYTTLTPKFMGGGIMLIINTLEK